VPESSNATVAKRKYVCRKHMRVNFLSWHRFLSAISTKKWWATEKTIAYFVADHCVPIHLEVAAAGLTWKGQQMLDSCCNTTKMRSLGHSSLPPLPVSVPNPQNPDSSGH